MFSPGYGGNTNADMLGRPVPMPQSQMFGYGFGGYQPPQAAPMNFVQGSITPRNVFTPELTQATVNQQRSQLAQQYNPLHLAKRYGGVGTSRNASTAARIAPQMAQGYAQMAAVGPMQGFQDLSANKQNFLRGQVAQDQEGDQWAGLLAQDQDADWSRNFSQFSNLLRLLMGGV